MIRKNDKLWGDFCLERYVWSDATQDYEEFFELSTVGYDTSDPTVVIPSTYKTVIPEPEIHLSFSTTLMVMAIELYQAESEKQFCHYVTYAHRKLVQFVESRKQITAESYRFFIENAYNQLFQHESFHTSAHSKTKAKDIGASGTPHTSTKLSGYVWLGSDTKVVHVPKDQAGDVQMDADDEEADDETNELPSLSVKVQKDDEVHEEVPDEPMEGVCSQEGEETQEQTGHSEETEKPDLLPARNPMERYGNYLMSHFSAKDYLKIRQWVFNLGNIIAAEEREDRRLPRTVEEVNTFGMVWLMASESQHDFMISYPTLTH